MATEANIPYTYEGDLITRAFKYVVDTLEDENITRRAIANAGGMDIRTLNTLIAGGGYKREAQLQKLLRGVAENLGDQLPCSSDGYPLLFQDFAAVVFGIDI